MIKTLQIVGLVLLSVLVLAFIVFLVVRAYYGWQTSRMSEYGEFAEDMLPSPAPEGQYSGTATVSSGSWQGKKFDSAASTGVNRFTEGDRYVFTTSTAKSLTDSSQQVLRIDYNQSSNPWWLRLVTDEVVQTAPNQLLGKIQINAIPSLPFTVGYFRLSK